MFWEKRLEGLRACDVDGHELRAMELPRGLRAVGPHVNEETLLQSVATALHVSNQPITGQTGSKSALEKNPGVFINPEQPLVQVCCILCFLYYYVFILMCVCVEGFFFYSHL